jgi:hypothetical protein
MAVALHECWPGTLDRAAAGCGTRAIEALTAEKRRGRMMSVRNVMAAWLTLVLILLALSVGRASDRDETTLTVQVSSADHEVIEGYFTLGDGMTVMVKPGSELHRFLSRQRGRKVKVTLSDAAVPELSRLDR